MRSRGLLPVDALSRRSNSTRLRARGSRRHTDDLRGIRCIVNKVCQYLGYRVHSRYRFVRVPLVRFRKEKEEEKNMSE